VRSVDEALNRIVRQVDEVFVFIRIQDLAKEMNYHYWKHRREILGRIREWVTEHPQRSTWVDKSGRRWLIGYGQQMCEVYGWFTGDNNMLELVRR